MVGLDEAVQNGIFTITPKSQNNEVVITKGTIEGNLSMNIYSVSGQLIQREEIINPTTSFSFNVERGIYLYEFINQNGQAISTGKFNF